MSTPIILENSTATQPPLTPQIGGEYLVRGDCGIWHASRLYRAVVLTDDGAWAGLLQRDGLGEYVVLAFTDDDDRIPAHDAWDSAIERAIGPAPASPSPEGGALVYPATRPAPRMLQDDLDAEDATLAAWAAVMFPPSVCACGLPIAYGATACLDCDPDQYESDRLFDLYPGARYEVAA